MDPDDEGLTLNALSRYEKQSTNLALLEYSHCEVPAGCGGAVLRWVDPRAGLPVQMWIFTPSKADVFLDGVAPTSNRPLIGTGTHVLAVRVEQAGLGGGALMFAARFEQEGRVLTADQARLAAVTPQLGFFSQAGDGWKVSAVAPPDDTWTTAGFDDRRWADAVEIGLPAPEPRSAEAWRQDVLVKQGARAIGLRGGTGPRWLRRRFVVDLGAPEAGR